MRKLYLCVLAITLSFIFGLVIKADTYSTFVTTDYYSKNRAFFVKVTPNKRATLYKGTRKIWTKLLPELPQDLLVTNNGKRVVMIENYYGNNNERKKEVIIFFNEKGNKISSQTLESLADFENVNHTVSNAHWLEKYELNQEKNEVVIATFILTCRLPERVSNEEDIKEYDECSQLKPKEKIGFSVIDGSLLYRTKIENTEK